MKKILNISFLAFILTLLVSCSGVKDTLSLKKKQSTEEFLVKKKKPLVIPPEFDELPVPVNEETQNEEIDDNIDISKVLKQKKTSNKGSKNASKDLEKSISNILNSK